MWANIAYVAVIIGGVAIALLLDRVFTPAEERRLPKDTIHDDRKDDSA